MKTKIIILILLLFFSSKVAAEITVEREFTFYPIEDKYTTNDVYPSDSSHFSVLQTEFGYIYKECYCNNADVYVFGMSGLPTYGEVISAKLKVTAKDADPGLGGTSYILQYRCYPTSVPYDSGDWLLDPQGYLIQGLGPNYETKTLKILSPTLNKLSYLEARLHLLDGMNDPTGPNGEIRVSKLSLELITVETYYEISLYGSEYGSVYFSSPTNSNGYMYGEEVVATATAYPGYEFIGWDELGNENPITISMLDDLYITPIFADTDSDNDGIPNAEDNCPDMYNPKQEDSDNNGIGDVCDIQIYPTPGFELILVVLGIITITINKRAFRRLK